MLSLITSFLAAQDASEIIKKVDRKMRGNSSSSNMTMKIVRPDWSREISMKGWSLGTDFSLILITAPARDQGTAFLKRDKE
ncbi:MAG: outer membrane lipoprotein-sorting protein, partial [Maribacter sp.]|nr:outer membrane lipoprotein-sorting protein [Maribacter sp.]